MCLRLCIVKAIQLASALLRDYQQPNLDAARQLSEQLQLQNLTFERADAFDRNSLAAITPRPTIAIASGIYELFPDNEPVLRSLLGIADAMDPGGFLIYTCQPWHPQVEFIARALTNREGKPWIMRRRPQAEMDALVKAAGFEKIDQDIRPLGNLHRLDRKTSCAMKPIAKATLAFGHSQHTVSRCVSSMQLDHEPASWGPLFLFWLGATSPFRARSDHSLHVDRSVFRDRTISR